MFKSLVKLIRKREEVPPSSVDLYTIKSLLPRYEGCYSIGESFHVYLTKRPMWLHRKMVFIILGWKWKDK